MRTTHVTGMLTDLGFLIGHTLRGNRSELWRFMLLSALLGAFFLGGLLGVEGWKRAGADALWLPTGLLAVLGASYLAWRQRLHLRDQPPQT